MEGRRPNPTAILLKASGLLFVGMIVWVNLSNGSQVERLLSTKDIVLNTPRKLETAPKTSLRSDTEITSKNIVTFVDNRIATFPKRTEEADRREKLEKEERQKLGLPEPTPKPAPPPFQLSRIMYLHACNSKEVTESTVREIAKRMYNLPPTKERISWPSKIEKCQYTFLDFGANVGDSLGKFIDSGMDNCQRTEEGLEFGPKYNLETGELDQFHEKDNPLVRFARTFTRKQQNKVGHYPEEYCYYGVEGNPVFTQRLKALEERVMSSTPRPVKNAVFFTETVGAGVDGPTTLYLDTISEDKNYWGSSVLTQPKYVRESAEKHNGGKPIAAPVQGITMSKLVEQTTLREEGSHLLIKVDIEGGEFALFEEVHRSGVLCDYTARGVDVNILVEKHGPQFAAANLDMDRWDTFMKDLTRCGVVIQGGGSAGR